MVSPDRQNKPPFNKLPLVLPSVLGSSYNVTWFCRCENTNKPIITIATRTVITIFRTGCEEGVVCDIKDLPFCMEQIMMIIRSCNLLIMIPFVMWHCNGFSAVFDIVPVHIKVVQRTVADLVVFLLCIICCTKIFHQV